MDFHARPYSTPCSPPPLKSRVCSVQQALRALETYYVYPRRPKEKSNERTRRIPAELYHYPPNLYVDAEDPDLFYNFRQRPCHYLLPLTDPSGLYKPVSWEDEQDVLSKPARSSYATFLSFKILIEYKYMIFPCSVIVKERIQITDFTVPSEAPPTTAENSYPRCFRLETPIEHKFRTSSVLQHRSYSALVKERIKITGLTISSKGENSQNSKNSGDQSRHPSQEAYLGRGQIEAWKNGPGRKKDWRRPLFLKNAFEKDVGRVHSRRCNWKTLRPSLTLTESADTHDGLSASYQVFPLDTPSVLVKSKLKKHLSSYSNRRRIIRRLTSSANEDKYCSDRRLSHKLWEEDLEDCSEIQPDIAIEDLDEE